MDHVPRNESDGFNWRQCKLSFFLNRFGWAWWLICVDDIDLVKDMPVCVQIVGGRFGEEKAVGVAKVVDEVMKGGR